MSHTTSFVRISPDDQTDFSAVFEYRLINSAAQDPFDHHAWQAFVSLNWPLGPDGITAKAVALAPETPDTRRAWARFARRDEVFRPNGLVTCPNSVDAIVHTSDLEQADGTVLIDQSGNFVVYETRLNPIAEAYIRGNELDNRAGQAMFDPQPVEFPQGRLGAEATPASVLLKTAWRIVQAEETGYLTASGLIQVPADKSDTGATLCLSVTLGMVGMHIVTRVSSGNGDEWLWSTFEHRDNVPVAESARNVNSLFALELFPEGCTHPPDASGRDWSFYNPARVDQPTNTPNGAKWSWASHTPPCTDWRRVGHTAANCTLLGSDGRHTGSERNLAGSTERLRSAKLHADFLAMAWCQQKPDIPQWRVASIPHQHDH